MMGARREEEVRILMGKTKDGQCQKKNPKGTSCKKEFEQEIATFGGHGEDPFRLRLKVLKGCSRT